MKRHELLDHLRRHGCNLWTALIYSNAATGAKAPVPRHGEIDSRLARRICEQLGIPAIR